MPKFRMTNGLKRLQKWTKNKMWANYILLTLQATYEAAIIYFKYADNNCRKRFADSDFAHGHLGTDVAMSLGRYTFYSHFHEFSKFWRHKILPNFCFGRLWHFTKMTSCIEMNLNLLRRNKIFKHFCRRNTFDNFL